ncbi:molybdate ABC transporter substrate-binding protein [Cellvibrio japonicus]|uniref:Molybdate ABC transporter, periplasmic molybdate-binding protein n=1 Tax=Cellvibrio japonicus (strain Ueda107) TaxID=498211 RepID=B3PHB9_CELJU|nr:molybdate ABC transporter substrate-binding protein [Cellvibrio japonicus]ACE82840.1 molybdate ABC transporter, periplasmic molybdate-binding protein [Cellvibrio japonicus Ueda107]QEI11035.1 molybdate ABC transporter substrate-binding protein [Cellvibrio japonicus]QEI14610.1 molybdate ABC transporter substrate-binding protein [Cellvibrio japonicus]QEI18189.1 molybdate ABC transporter substrate-binding protein [Cellvibrio japonicus]
MKKYLPVVVACQVQIQSLHRAFLLSLLLCVMLISGAARAGDIHVYAAASLTDAIGELGSAYEKTHKGVGIKASYAGSSTLAKQIENGAPAQLFISADQDWANYLQERQLLDENSRVNLLLNELVLIVPAGRKVDIRFDKDADLIASFNGKLCTGDPSHVPVGKYARQALEYYGWWDSIQPRLVGTPDVRTALAFVERGECALGIVYKTDALLTDKVDVVASFPAQSHVPIVYPGGLVRGANADAEAFWQFLQSDKAAQVFQRYGFKRAQ